MEKHTKYFCKGWHFDLVYTTDAINFIEMYKILCDKYRNVLNESNYKYNLEYYKPIEFDATDILNSRTIKDMNILVESFEQLGNILNDNKKTICAFIKETYSISYPQFSIFIEFPLEEDFEQMIDGIKLTQEEFDTDEVCQTFIENGKKPTVFTIE